MIMLKQQSSSGRLCAKQFANGIFNETISNIVSLIQKTRQIIRSFSTSPTLMLATTMAMGLSFFPMAITQSSELKYVKKQRTHVPIPSALFYRQPTSRLVAMAEPICLGTLMGDIYPHIDVQVIRIRDRYLALSKANYRLPLTNSKQYHLVKVILLY